MLLWLLVFSALGLGAWGYVSHSQPSSGHLPESGSSPQPSPQPARHTSASMSWSGDFPQISWNKTQVRALSEALLNLTVSISQLTQKSRNDAPTIVSRKEWGAGPLTCRAQLTLPVVYVITEQLTGLECREENVCQQRLRDLRSHSVYTKGWCDVAFNFLVGGDGRVYEGIGWNVRGMHSQGYNSVSLGIAFFGNMIGSDPSPSALSAAEDLISYAIQKGHLSPRYIQPLLLKACPNIITRSAWEARETHCPKMNLPAKYVIIIHTAGIRCNISMDCQFHVRDLQSFHMDTQNFCDIGYHFLVGQDGGVYEGVGWHVQGSHTYGYNDIALGIAFMGNFVEKPPNAAALEAAQNLIQCAVNEGYLMPNYLLLGHSDVSSTLSPGQALYNIIKTWPHFKH